MYKVKKTLNGAFVNQIPFIKSDFGSPWSIAFHHGDDSRLKGHQTVYYSVNYVFGTGTVFNSYKMSGLFRDRI